MAHKWPITAKRMKKAQANIRFPSASFLHLWVGFNGWPDVLPSVAFRLEKTYLGVSDKIQIINNRNSALVLKQG